MGERKLNLKFNRNVKCHKNGNEEKSRNIMLVESAVAGKVYGGTETYCQVTKSMCMPFAICWWRKKIVYIITIKPRNRNKNK